MQVTYYKNTFDYLRKVPDHTVRNAALYHAFSCHRAFAYTLTSDQGTDFLFYQFFLSELEEHLPKEAFSHFLQKVIFCYFRLL